MRWSVVDASVIVWLLTDPSARAGRGSGVLEGAGILAPGHLELEVLNGLRGLWSGRKLSDQELLEATSALGSLPLVLVPIRLLIARIWELRHNLTAYDAAYVALAESTELELLTMDAGIAAAPGARCRIVHLGG